MSNQELIQALREHAEWQRGNEWETPITLGDDFVAAADRIEAQAEFDKARAAGQEWNRRNGIKLKGRECDGKTDN